MDSKLPVFRVEGCVLSVEGSNVQLSKPLLLLLAKLPLNLVNL